MKVSTQITSRPCEDICVRIEGCRVGGRLSVRVSLNVFNLSNSEPLFLATLPNSDDHARLVLPGYRIGIHAKSVYVGRLFERFLTLVCPIQILRLLIPRSLVNTLFYLRLHPQIIIIPHPRMPKRLAHRSSTCRLACGLKRG